jgi:flagellar protein FliS
MSPQSLQTRYRAEALSTASPARIVVMAFDRLDRDLAGAIAAIETRQVERSHELLCHAQDLVHELLGMLDLDVWEHAGTLASIYRYVIELLVSANVHKSIRPADEARTLLAELGDAFRQAAVSVAAASPSAEPATPTPPAAAPPAERPRALAGAAAPRATTSFSAIG